MIIKTNRDKNKSKILSKSFLDRAERKWEGTYKKAGNYTSQIVNYGHVYKRRKLQAASGRALDIINIPKEKRGAIMRLTQDILNLEGLTQTISASGGAHLTEKCSSPPPKNHIKIKQVLDKMRIIIGNTELLEQYFETLGDILNENLSR